MIYLFKLAFCYILLLSSIFHSCKKEDTPTLKTSAVGDITGTSASCGGTISNEGSSSITDRGVCWSTTTNPSISDSKTQDGNGTGPFTSLMSGLNGGIKYFIRAYATNDAGTAYGNELTFTTVSEQGSKTTLTITGQAFTSSDKDVWIGVNIARSKPTDFAFTNNTITSVNDKGYLLQAGDEGKSSSNNMLDGEVITGNRFNWSGVKSNSIIPHGIFTGNNINAVIKYNYLDEVPMAIIAKSSSDMVYTSGGIAYNIVRGGSVAINIKGVSGVTIFNNTLYSNRTTSETHRGLIDVYSNNSPVSKAHGTIIKNNIFYTKYSTYCIQIDDADALNGLVSDYNIFYSEAGMPLFDYCGTSKTFAQWQALGYDTHSVVVNPNFNNFTDFVPAVRLDYGTDLGSSWITGLSTSATWALSISPATTDQNGTWQVGARVYPGN